MRYFIYCRKSSEGEERQVLSLASQQEALAKAFGDTAKLEIVGVYEESKSAKTPGRPLFAEMLRRIEAGEADGIASWAPDRLARNSIDGGHIIYLLDQGKLHDLKFATYTFENNSQGKFMLSIMFGQSKYYSDALSENVKRGNATKVAMGWRPSRPPMGYITCPQTRTIIRDPEMFPVVRRMFDFLLSENYSPRQITLMARDEWGVRSHKRRRRGGAPLSLSGVYKIFANPFYNGQFLWNGVLYQGQHEPLVTHEEFARVQAVLKRDGKARPQKHSFPFVGMIRCGDCGLMITAETKRNAYNSLYTYYHCTRRGLGPRCPEPSVSGDQMETAMAGFLGSLSIPDDIENWVRERLLAEDGHDRGSSEAAAATRAATIFELGAQLQELNRLRVRRMIDDEEYVTERNRLTQERKRLQEHGEAQATVKPFELFEHVVSFSKYAVEWFLGADPDTQRLIVTIAGSNFSMAGKIVIGEAVKPFYVTPKKPDIVLRCTLGEDVLTKSSVETQAEEWAESIRMISLSENGEFLLNKFKNLRHLIGHPVAFGDSATRKGRGID